MAKLPSFSFYPGDWLRNEVSGCSLEAQGLWLRMMIVMHDAEVYGELSIGGEPMPDAFLAKKCGISTRKLKKYLNELESFCVINRTKTGVIYSGRMKRDEAKRQQNAGRQRDFYERHKDEPNGKPNAQPNAPSSSSSSFSLSEEEEKEEEKRPPQAAPPPEPEPDPVPESKPKPKRGTRLPEPFNLTKAMREFATERRPFVDVLEETEKFCNYWRAKSGRDASKIDWDATWRNWILNAKGQINGQHQATNGKPTNRSRIEDTKRVIAKYPTEAELAAVGRENQRDDERPE